ncbi:hypothetical protein MYX75_10825 [Acidobacteria bacterium AH-259-A15]|nr:hypothetical protein [Acidobacteria bacterium AH-259-A15]
MKIARGLGEEAYLPIFRALVKRYPEEIIRRAYEEALQIPAEKIRKSRGAIFNYLVKKYARQDSQNTRH